MELLKELLKANDNLQHIEFTINEKQFDFYFKYLTILEKIRIDEMCVKPETTIKPNGEREVKYVHQSELQPIHTILEKALDKYGKRLFSHTNPEHFKAISSLPYGIASFVAYEMYKDILGNMTKKADDE